MYHFELKPTRHASIEKEFERIFDVFTKSDNFAPQCEIIDEEKSYSISLDIPGLSKEDIELEVKDNHLFISGERKTTNSGKDVLRSEKKYGKFSRIFALPKNVNTDGIEARFANGVLEVILPKEEKSQPKKISISDWKDDPSSLKN
jgi:HSP20 family protein